MSLFSNLAGGLFSGCGREDGLALTGKELLAQLVRVA